MYLTKCYCVSLICVLERFCCLCLKMYVHTVQAGKHCALSVDYAVQCSVLQFQCTAVMLAFPMFVSSQMVGVTISE